MTITVTPPPEPGRSSSTAAPFSLAEGGRAGPANLKIREERASQLVEFFRSNNAGTFDRLNRRIALAFDVTRAWPSVDAAQSFLLQHSQLMPTSGTLAATGEGDGGGFLQFFLPNAHIKLVEGSHLGSSTHHRYQITAPNIQTTSP